MALWIEEKSPEEDDDIVSNWDRRARFSLVSGSLDRSEFLALWFFFLLVEDVLEDWTLMWRKGPNSEQPKFNRLATSSF